MRYKKIELVQLDKRSMFVYTDLNGAQGQRMSPNYCINGVAVRLEESGRTTKRRMGSISEYLRNEYDLKRLRKLAQKYGLTLNGRIAIEAKPIDLDQPANTLRPVHVEKKKPKPTQKRIISAEAWRRAKSI